MKTITTITFTLFAIILVSLPASAYWPTTLEENLAVGAYPDTAEYSCFALPYPDDGILVVLRKGWVGPSYQIIDRYGEFEFPEPLSLYPNISNCNVDKLQVVSDGVNGAFIAWDCLGTNPINGICAQRLDSLGNIMWGDSGVVISPYEEVDFDISVDGEGGFYLAISPGEAAGFSDLYVQRIDGEGNLLWGNVGVPVCTLPLCEARFPKITPDGDGGAFVIWEDSRPPYNYWGAVFAQHLDGEGNILWPNDLFIVEDVWYFDLISDSEGGFIVQFGGGGFNFAYRISPDGVILWERDHVSYYVDPKIIEGELDFFYLGFTWGSIYGQRMDIEGNFHWPSWPTAYGAVMISRPGWFHDGGCNWFYQFPYFYSISGFSLYPSYTKYLVVQKADSLANRLLGDEGAVLTYEYITSGNFYYLSAIGTEDGGVVAVFEIQEGNSHDVWAKRCRSDGTLGGPLHLLVDLTPHNPPVQIPPSGGSFTYDISIEDTYSVAGVFDAWIEATLPGGDRLELLVREDLTIESNSTIIRTDLQQFIPYRAPAGEYNYTAYVGNHEYNSVWAVDSFTFEKLPGMDSGRASLAGMTSNSEAAGMTDEGWMLEGFFDGSLEGSIESASAKSPAGLSRLSAFPNPFNDETEISFTLFESSEIELSVYDISGREVVRLAAGFRNPGSHTVNWKADAIPSGIYFVRLRAGNHSCIIKVGLVK